MSGNSQNQTAANVPAENKNAQATLLDMGNYLSRQLTVPVKTSNDLKSFIGRASRAVEKELQSSYDDWKLVSNKLRSTNDSLADLNKKCIDLEQTRSELVHKLTIAEIKITELEQQQRNGKNSDRKDEQISEAKLHIKRQDKIIQDLHEKIQEMARAQTNDADDNFSVSQQMHGGMGGVLPPPKIKFTDEMIRYAAQATSGYVHQTDDDVFGPREQGFNSQQQPGANAPSDMGLKNRRNRPHGNRQAADDLSIPTGLPRRPFRREMDQQLRQQRSMMALRQTAVSHTRWGDSDTEGGDSQSQVGQIVARGGSETALVDSSMMQHGGQQQQNPTVTIQHQMQPLMSNFQQQPTAPAAAATAYMQLSQSSQAVSMSQVPPPGSLQVLSSSQFTIPFRNAFQRQYELCQGWVAVYANETKDAELDLAPSYQSPGDPEIWSTLMSCTHKNTADAYPHTMALLKDQAARTYLLLRLMVQYLIEKVWVVDIFRGHDAGTDSVIDICEKVLIGKDRTESLRDNILKQRAAALQRLGNSDKFDEFRDAILSKLTKGMRHLLSPFLNPSADKATAGAGITIFVKHGLELSFKLFAAPMETQFTFPECASKFSQLSMYARNTVEAPLSLQRRQARVKLVATPMITARHYMHGSVAAENISVANVIVMG